MNNTNITDDPQFDPDYDKNYLKKNEELLNELLDLPYNEILKKHEKEEFFNDVFDRAVDGDVVLLGRLIADDFIPEKVQNGVVPLRLSSSQNEAIIEILAEDQSQNPAEVLKQIQIVLQGATLPQNFDWLDYHNRSVKVYNATLSLKAVLAENNAFNYQNDVKIFLKLNETQLKEILAEETKISEKLQAEYEKLIEGTLPDPKVLEEAINFLGHCGRTSVQMNALKEKKNLGVISEIIIKIDRAIKIVLDIKAKNIKVDSDTDLLTAIAHHLLDNTHL